MKRITIKKSVLSLTIIILMVFAATAQISTPEGQIQGGGTKDSGHFVDKPSMHVHEETSVIEKKKAAHGVAQGKGSAGQQAGDTAQQAQAMAAADTATNMQATSEAGGTTMVANTTEQGATGMTQNLSPVYTALTIFGIGALLGLLLLATILRGNSASPLMALVHGALGLIGIGILIGYCMFFNGPVVAVVILAIAATGGIIVFYKNISSQPAPKWLAAAHGVIAAAGIVVLVVYAVGSK